MMSKTNLKWTTKIKERMKYRLCEMGRSIQYIFADSNEHSLAKKNYLPGGIMNCI